MPIQASTVARRTLHALQSSRAAASAPDQFAYELDLFRLSLTLEHRIGARVRLDTSASCTRSRVLVYRVGRCRVSARVLPSGSIRLHCPAPVDADAFRAALLVSTH